MAKEIRHTVKDNIFRDLFSDVQYVFQLYQSLHPEDNKGNYAGLRPNTRAFGAIRRHFVPNTPW